LASESTGKTLISSFSRQNTQLACLVWTTAKMTKILLFPHSSLLMISEVLKWVN
jgi:hypothetical protein